MQSLQRPDLIDMGRKFHAATGHASRFDEAAFCVALDQIEAQGGLFTSKRGMIGGVIAPMWCAPDWKAAVELFWWAEDGQGLRLLRRFEQWARDMGAQEIRMTTLAAMPEAERALRHYERAETSWTRAVLPPAQDKD